MVLVGAGVAVRHAITELRDFEELQHVHGRVHLRNKTDLVSGKAYLIKLASSNSETQGASRNLDFRVATKSSEATHSE